MYLRVGQVPVTVGRAINRGYQMCISSRADISVPEGMRVTSGQYMQYLRVGKVLVGQMSRRVGLVLMLSMDDLC